MARASGPIKFRYYVERGGGGGGGGIAHAIKTFCDIAKHFLWY